MVKLKLYSVFNVNVFAICVNEKTFETEFTESNPCDGKKMDLV